MVPPGATTLLAIVAVVGAGAPTAPAETDGARRQAREAQQPSPFAGYPFAPRPCDRPIRFHRSRAVGRPYAGRLVRGVKLPPDGCDFFTWDFPLAAAPNRFWRRWGTDYLVRKVLRVLKRFRETHPDAPRIGVADLSRRRGGIFDERFGGLGHSSHQNGRDIDVLYPRTDRLEQVSTRVREVDRELSQALVRAFLRAHVQYIFVGPDVGLRGPPGIVQPLRNHDDHMHVRIYARKRKPPPPAPLPY